MPRSHRWFSWPMAARAMAVALLGAIIVSACTVTPPFPPPPTPTQTPRPDSPPEGAIADTNWELHLYAGDQGEMVDVLAGTRITLAFSADQYAGSAGCNRYGGAYTLASQDVSLHPPTLTERACAAPVMQQEDAYLSALGRIARIVRTEGALDMLDTAGTVVLSYTLIEPLPLVGPTWQVTAYNNGTGGAVTLLPGSTITLTFGSEGQLAGSAGCNTYSASFQVETPALTIGPPVATRRMCAEPAGVMEQEAAYLAALSTTVSFAIHGDRLAVRDAQGATVLEAVAPLDAHDPATPVGGSEAAAPLVRKTWQLATYTDAEGQPVGPLPDTQVTIEFIKGSFAGNASCNRYTGRYTLNGDQISVELGATTLMACPEAIMGQERAYLTALSQSATYRASNNRLDLFDVSGRTLLTYTALAGQASSAPAGPVTPVAPQLVGPTWQWLETKGGDGALLVIQAPDRYTVTFMPDGTAAVQADCNTGGGTYTAEGSTLRIDVNALTEMACPQGSLSERFVQSLNAAATYVIVDGSLHVNMKMDSGDMKFAPAAGQ